MVSLRLGAGNHCQERNAGHEREHEAQEPEPPNPRLSSHLLEPPVSASWERDRGPAGAVRPSVVACLRLRTAQVVLAFLVVVVVLAVVVIVVAVVAVVVEVAVESEGEKGNAAHSEIDTGLPRTISF